VKIEFLRPHQFFQIRFCKVYGRIYFQGKLIIADCFLLFIRDYKVLTEFMSATVYRVLVQATILSESLKQKMTSEGLAHGSDDKEIRKALIVSGDRAPFPSLLKDRELSDLLALSSYAIAAALKRKGFFVIVKDSETISLRGGSSARRQIINLGKAFHADVVITTGIAVQKFGKTASNLYKGNLTIRAFSVETGEELGSLEKKSEAAHNMHATPDLREAVSNAGAIAGEELSLLIAPGFWKEAEQDIEVEIAVDEKIFFPYFVMFKKHLKGVPGVSDIRTKEMMSNKATLIAGFRGSAETLSKYLMKKKDGSFFLVITEITPNRIGLKISSR